MIAALILVGLGLRIDAWSAFGVEVNLGIFAIPVVVFWVLLVVNAFNLVDGMDGFCGSLGLVAALATFGKGVAGVGRDLLAFANMFGAIGVAAATPVAP